MFPQLFLLKSLPGRIRHLPLDWTVVWLGLNTPKLCQWFQECKQPQTGRYKLSHKKLIGSYLVKINEAVRIFQEIETEVSRVS